MGFSNSKIAKKLKISRNRVIDAQINDWLKDKFHIQSTAENTIRNYVNHLREYYHITKVAVNRMYGAVDELPPGQQIQVDFGEMIVDTSSGGRQKLYVEIVYDQDRLLAVSENAGDLILTESFTKYYQFRQSSGNIILYFIRKPFNSFRIVVS